jgi:hypothetical protein
MAEIIVTPESGLFGKEITVKIGDKIKVGLNGTNWRPGGKSFADMNMSPLTLDGPAFRDLDTKRMGFIFLARATGRDELTFTSEDEGSKVVMGVNVIVTK